MRKIKNKWLSLTLSYGLVFATFAAITPMVVSCSNTLNIDKNYNVDQEFGKIYTEKLFKENIEMFEKFDGSNQLWEIKNQNKVLLEKDYLCLLFKTSAKKVEFKYKVLMNTSKEPKEEIWDDLTIWSEFTFISPNKISMQSKIESKKNPSLNITASSKEINVETFLQLMNHFTLKSFNSNNSEWKD